MDVTSDKDTILNRNNNLKQINHHYVVPQSETKIKHDTDIKNININEFQVDEIDDTTTSEC